MNNFNDKVSFTWSVADLLRGPYKPAQYGDVMLPLVVLRRVTRRGGMNASHLARTIAEMTPCQPGTIYPIRKTCQHKNVASTANSCS
jgi:hypothetical protein